MNELDQLSRAAEALGWLFVIVCALGFAVPVGLGIARLIAARRALHRAWKDSLI